jgi:hypothetical protein
MRETRDENLTGKKSRKNHFKHTSADTILCADSKYLICLKSNWDYSLANRPIPVKKIINKMLITFERNKTEGWALCGSTHKCLSYRSTKLELIVGLEIFFGNSRSTSTRKIDQLDQYKIMIISYCFTSPTFLFGMVKTADL